MMRCGRSHVMWAVVLLVSVQLLSFLTRESSQEIKRTNDVVGASLDRSVPPPVAVSKAETGDRFAVGSGKRRSSEGEPTPPRPHHEEQERRSFSPPSSLPKLRFWPLPSGVRTGNEAAEFRSTEFVFTAESAGSLVFLRDTMHSLFQRVDVPAPQMVVVTESNKSSLRKGVEGLLRVHVSLSLGDCGNTSHFVLGTEKGVPFGANEGYSLTLSKVLHGQDSAPGVEGVLESCALPGLLRGAATLAQVLGQRLRVGKFQELPMIINDAPRLRVRGLLIDTGRAFFPVAYLKRIIHGMALLKLNYLHWHLVDDQSFPIEIRSVPSLHQAGAGWLGYIHNQEVSECSQPPGRFYKQGDIAELVEFARSRGVRIVPELDLPAHARSWGIGNKNLTVDCPGWVASANRRKGQYTANVPLNILGKELWATVSKVIEELVALFPDPWFHTGGDEVPKRCLQEARIPADEVPKFQNRIAGVLEGHKKHAMLAWDDSFGNGLSPPKSLGLIFQEWQGEKKIANIIKSGAYAIQSGKWYFDLAGACPDADACRKLSTASIPRELQPKFLGAVACAWELTLENCTSIEDTGAKWPRQFGKKVWTRLAGASAAWWDSRPAVGGDPQFSEVSTDWEAVGDLLKVEGIDM